jgi:hypothetical protein
MPSNVGKKKPGQKAAKASPAKAKTKAKAKAKVKPTAKAKVKPTAKAKLKPTAKAKLKPTAKAKLKPTAKAKLKPTAKVKATAKKSKPVARPQKKATAKKPRVRRDATGHLDPAYARDLLRLSRQNAEHDDDRAFLIGERADDALAQELGAEFVETVTSGEDEGVELRDESVVEEEGGPFVTTTEATEFAREPDASNPIDATREPFPKT